MRLHRGTGPRRARGTLWAALCTLLVPALAWTAAFAQPAPSPETAPAAAAGAIPAAFFGMTYFERGDYPAPPVLMTGALGKGVGVTWPYLQHASICPTSPCAAFEWHATDLYAGMAASHGVEWFYAFDNVPRWAVSNTSGCGTYGEPADMCTNTATHLSDWTRYVTALVQRYDGTTGHGRIAIYELWNEPDNPEDWTDTTANLAALAVEAVRIIRANDAAKGIHTIIATPSGTAGFLAPFMSAYAAAGGSAADFDAVSLHAYYASAKCAGLPAPCAEAVLNDAAAFKAEMARLGLAGRPLFDTEGSFGSAEDYGALTGEEQVAFVARWHLLHWSGGVSRMMWYAADNGTWGTLCATTNPCTLNAAGAAYNQVYGWMVGAAMPAPCASSDTVWTCTLIDPAGAQTLAVWNTRGSSSYTVPSGYGHYKDLAGNTETIAGGTVGVGIQPILLTP